MSTLLKENIIFILINNTSCYNWIFQTTMAALMKSTIIANYTVTALYFGRAGRGMGGGAGRSCMFRIKC